MNKKAKKTITMMEKMERLTNTKDVFPAEEDVLMLIGLIQQSDVEVFFNIKGRYDPNNLPKPFNPCSENQQIGIVVQDPETTVMYGVTSFPWKSINKLLHITKKAAIAADEKIHKVPSD